MNKMGVAWSLSVVFALLLLASSCSGVPQPVSEPSIDLTRYFTPSATSVCGDPPTQFELPKNSGQLQTCNGSQYAVENALDGNFSTRWQSANGETPVSLSLALNKVCLLKEEEAI